MIVVIQFSADNIPRELETIAREIESHRTFGLGWQVYPDGTDNRCAFQNNVGECRLGGRVPVRGRAPGEPTS